MLNPVNLQLEEPHLNDLVRQQKGLEKSHCVMKRWALAILPTLLMRGEHMIKI